VFKKAPSPDLPSSLELPLSLVSQVPRYRESRDASLRIFVASDGDDVPVRLFQHSGDAKSCGSDPPVLNAVSATPLESNRARPSPPPTTICQFDSRAIAAG